MISILVTRGPCNPSSDAPRPVPGWLDLQDAERIYQDQRMLCVGAMQPAMRLGLRNHIGAGSVARPRKQLALKAVNAGFGPFRTANKQPAGRITRPVE